jgi:CO dehydrogenase maturation factor
MSFSIALAGKGGSGKTSIASLIIRYLVKNKKAPVLAVDADGNANLGESLGLKVDDTIGSIIARFNEDKFTIPAGFTKTSYLELKLNKAVIESRDFDLISMGRGEGTGCYCYPNSVLKKFIDEMKENYPYMVMDNEAGMEHLSRHTTENIDELLIVSDYSIKGIRTVERIIKLISELKLNIKRQSVIINRAPDVFDDNIKRELENTGIVPLATIPVDENIFKYDLEQISLLEIPDTSKAVVAIDKFMERMLGKS